MFPADGEYKLSGRLVTRRRGRATPASRATTGRTSSSSRRRRRGVLGADRRQRGSRARRRERHERSRDAVDAQMTRRRSTITAGPHEVGFTWRERTVRAAGRVAARRCATPGGPHIRRACRGSRPSVVEGPYNVDGHQQHAEPRAAVRLQARRRPPRNRRARRRSSRTSRAARTAGPSRRRRRAAARVLHAGARERRRLRRRHPRGRGAHARRARRSCTASRRDPADVPAGATHSVSDLELASRLSFFLWSSIPDEKLLGLAEPGRLREPGVLDAQVRPHDRGRARRCAGQQFRRPVAAAAQPRDRRSARPADVPGFRRQHPEGVPPRDRDVLRDTSCARTAARPRAAERRLHVPERAAGEALRHPRRLRRALPPGEADRSEPPRPARPGQHPVADRGGDAHLAGVPRQVHPDHVLNRRRRRRRRTCRRSRKAQAARTAPKTVREQLELHRKNPPCACCHSIIDPPGFALENFNSVGSGATRRARARRSTPPACWRTARQVDGPVALRERDPERPEAFVTTRHAKAADLRAGPRARAGRHAGRPPHREKGGAERLPLRRRSSWASSRARRSRCGPNWSRVRNRQQVAQAKE